MSVARVSLLGLMRYDSDLFEEVRLPAAPWSKYFTENNIDIPEPDKDILIAHILRRAANLEIFLPNVQTVRPALKVWSITNGYKWKKLWESLHYEYNPIWNKDAYYTEEEHFTRDLKDEYDEDATNNNTKTFGKKVTGSGSQNSTSTDRVSAYNVNGFQDREQNTYNETTSSTEQESGTEGDAASGTRNGTNDATGTTDTLRTRREYGNIGVTTTMQMLKEQRELAAFNWYDMVCDSFIAEFCIDVF